MFLSFILLLSCTPETSLWTASLLGSFNILAYFLDYAISPYSSSPLCDLLPYSPISYGWQPLFWHVPYFTLAFRLSHVYVLVSSACIPSSALDASCTRYYSSYLSTLVLFELPSSVLFPAVLPTSRPPPILVMHIPYASFGTITFIRIHILILVWVCQDRIGRGVPIRCLPYSLVCSNWTIDHACLLYTSPSPRD